MFGFVEFELCPVGFEADGAAGFVGNPIEVGESPELVGEEGFELFSLGHYGSIVARCFHAFPCID